MVLLLILGAFVALAILSCWYGYDSRELGELERHERARHVLRDGDLKAYVREVKAADCSRARRADGSVQAHRAEAPADGSTTEVRAYPRCGTDGATLQPRQADAG